MYNTSLLTLFSEYFLSFPVQSCAIPVGTFDAAVVRFRFFSVLFTNSLTGFPDFLRKSARTVGIGEAPDVYSRNSVNRVPISCDFKSVRAGVHFTLVPIPGVWARADSYCRPCVRERWALFEGGSCRMSQRAGSPCFVVITGGCWVLFIVYSMCALLLHIGVWLYLFHSI